MRRPGFKVTGALVVWLVLLGLAKRLLAPMLPPSQLDRPITRPTDQQPPAAVVEIGWRTNISQAKKEAASTQKILLIFAANPASKVARRLEEDAFRKPEVVRLIRQSFVPVQINLDEFPEWDQSLLPVSRTIGYIDPGMMLLTSRPDGVRLDVMLVEQSEQYFGFEAVQNFLLSARVRNAEFDRRPPRAGELNYEHQLQAEFLNELTDQRAVAVTSFLARVMKNPRTENELFIVFGFEQVRPLALRLMARNGQLELAHKIARAQMLSDLYDPVDGGFFLESASVRSHRVDTSKSMIENALIAEVYAEIAVATSDAELVAASVDIVRSLESERAGTPTLRANQLNDQIVSQRSGRYSLTRSALSRMLSIKDMAWVQDHLLIKSDAGQELARLPNLALLTDPEFLRIRALLQQKGVRKPDQTTPERVDVHGNICARLFRIARLTGNDEVLQIASRNAFPCYKALGPAGVSKLFGDPTDGWLGSYLALADVGISEYLVTGNRVKLDIGFSALELALDRFSASNRKVVVRTPANVPLGGLWPSTCELLDPGRESLSAQAIRLCWEYAFVTKSPAKYARLREFARQSSLGLAIPLEPANIQATGFYVSAQLALGLGGHEFAGKGAILAATLRARNSVYGRFCFAKPESVRSTDSPSEQFWNPGGATEGNPGSSN